MPDKQTESFLKTVPEALLEALPYIHKFSGATFVIKYGGAAIKQNGLRSSFAKELVLLQKVGIRTVLVHGGGDAISEATEQRNLKPKKIDGKRVTTKEIMDIVREVLGGRVNQDIVQLLISNGGKACGVSGLSMDLIHVVPCQNAALLGYVGDVESINVENLLYLLERFIPVIAPLGIGPDGALYNINADDAASAIATALKAEKLIYMSDVDGILDSEKTTIQAVSEKMASTMIQEGVIKSGMIPKTLSGIQALKKGVGAVHMINGNLHSLLLEIFTDRGVGTKLTLL
ncbi:MAG: acetylglutamate kinase [Candidatus Moraniibacteriota bacterium]